MSEMLDAGAANDLNDGQMKAVSARGRAVLLAKVGGSFYAVDNTCSHLKGELSKGTLKGFTVTCPRHGSQFDVRNGENLRWLKGSGIGSAVAKLVKPPHPLASYRVEVKNDRVMIEIK